ncbi:MAG: GTP-binding protein TypA [Microgenomates group bacterium Gr01-1014_7]|nr:MAG: GTP-binding protein TypA [Microgenomates group bacterium Gr01-1014_7]
MTNIRNIAIIAHVDHGKTTLVDALLRGSQTDLGKGFTDESKLIMDSNDLEKERGITIFSKNASVNWKDTKINIIDTPGHADFGGEVERVLKMADGALLLIDAKEGPMPQTRFVLKKALELGHKIIVVINKIDKPDTRIPHVINKVFDLFIELGADEKTAYFPTVYSSGKQGKAGLEPDLSKMDDISPVFDAVLQHIPAPEANAGKPLQVLITSTIYDNFKGAVATGRIYSGTIQANQEVAHINREGVVKKFKLTSLLGFEGLERVDIKAAHAGDIIALSGIPDITIGETIADPLNPVALPVLDIEQSTVSMNFGVNTSPFAGREGEFKTARQISERLFKAVEADVALKVEDGPSGDLKVSGRGELHLAILIERLRREDYEFQVGKPQVIEKVQNGKTLTPYEKVAIEVPETMSGTVMQNMGLRHGQLTDMTTENGITYLEFIIATKEFFGYRSQFSTDTKGLGVLNSSFFEYRPDSGTKFERPRGSLVVHEAGTTKLYALTGAQGRGVLFIGPGVEVYKGQVIGSSSRGEDIRINVCKEKQQTNHRSSGEGTSEHFNSPKQMSLENAIEYIDESELVEVTPKNIRIRKIDLG